MVSGITVKKSTVDDKTKTQSGYGFVYFSKEAAGVAATMRRLVRNWFVVCDVCCVCVLFCAFAVLFLCFCLTAAVAVAVCCCCCCVLLRVAAVAGAACDFPRNSSQLSSFVARHCESTNGPERVATLPHSAEMPSI
jgi:hypothetical protein